VRQRPGFRRPRRLASDAVGGVLSFVLEMAVVTLLALIALAIAAVTVLLV
jgi:hypothetical protein